MNDTYHESVSTTNISLNNSLASQENIMEDLYSLGICLIHCCYPFKSDEKQQQLTSDQLEKRLKFIEEFYSKNFGQIIRDIISMTIGKCSLRRVLIFVKNYKALEGM